MYKNDGRVFSLILKYGKLYFFSNEKNNFLSYFKIKNVQHNTIYKYN